MTDSSGPALRHEDEPVDADVDLHVPAQRFELRRAPWGTLASISAGGVLGAWARYGIGSALPHAAGTFAWSTLLINVTGCALIGVLMVAITEIWQVHPLTRPFLGVGVLGGYTTFSTFITDAQSGIEHGHPAAALLYLAATAVTALLAVTTAVHLTRLAAGSRVRKESRS